MYTKFANDQSRFGLRMKIQYYTQLCPYSNSGTPLAWRSCMMTHLVSKRASLAKHCPQAVCNISMLCCNWISYRNIGSPKLFWERLLTLPVYFWYFWSISLSWGRQASKFSQHKMKGMQPFRLWRAAQQQSGLLFRCPKWNLQLSCVAQSSHSPLTTHTTNGATYGYVTRGTAEVHDSTSKLSVTLNQGQYWTSADGCIISPDEQAEAFVVQKSGFRSMTTFGGPIERKGRLRYIDGCSDSVLLSPPRLGDPCLNLLHFPANVRQSAHTHPSIRVGVVASGNGYCLLHDGSADILLERGCIFVIPEDLLHSFETKESEMRVIAFHPDSDCGPTDEDHPMLNKTILAKWIRSTSY